VAAHDADLINSACVRGKRLAFFTLKVRTYAEEIHFFEAKEITDLEQLGAALVPVDLTIINAAESDGRMETVVL
jgi:hypothetical protein